MSTLSSSSSFHLRPVEKALKVRWLTPVLETRCCMLSPERSLRGVTATSGPPAGARSQMIVRTVCGSRHAPRLRRESCPRFSRIRHNVASRRGYRHRPSGSLSSNAPRWSPSQPLRTTSRSQRHQAVHFPRSALEIVKVRETRACQHSSAPSLLDSESHRGGHGRS